jgi:hypothetical protein
MHKNTPVVDMKIDEATASIAKLGKIHDIRHLPLGISVHKTGIDRKMLNDWWAERSIPASRDGIREALETIGIHRATFLLTKCYGLSLSDQYWICPKDSGLRWDDVNFFDNDFPKDIGEILFGHEPTDPDHVSLMSPDNTSDGWLRKRWIIVDGKRLLMKGGSGLMKQEPFNEVIACAIMRRLNIPHINYTLTFDKGKPYSLCETFVTPDTELVPAWRIHSHFKKDNRESNFNYLLRACEMLGIPSVQSALDKMLTLDYIIANEDRHYNNFGFIRNADTLEWIGFSPIFDSGTSLWHNNLHVGSPVKSKPFRSSHNEQVKLVNDLLWFDYDALDGLSDEIEEILSRSEDVGKERSAAIASEAIKRCGHIKEMAK